MWAESKATFQVSEEVLSGQAQNNLVKEYLRKIFIMNEISWFTTLETPAFPMYRRDLVCDRICPPLFM